MVGVPREAWRWSAAGGAPPHTHLGAAPGSGPVHVGAVPVPEVAMDHNPDGPLTADAEAAVTNGALPVPVAGALRISL